MTGAGVIMIGAVIIMMTARVVMAADMDIPVDTVEVMIVGKGYVFSEMYVLYRKKPK